MSHQQHTFSLQRLKEGDPRAFDELYLKYFKLLCASAYFILKNESEAKDIVQGLFLDILEKRIYMHFQDDVKGYLFTAIRNRCLNKLKSLKVNEVRKENYGRLQREEMSPAEEADAETYHSPLESLMEAMKGQKKVALEMVYLQDKKYKDAASAMGISVNSLKTHLKGALKILRKNMNKN